MDVRGGERSHRIAHDPHRARLHAALRSPDRADRTPAEFPPGHPRGRRSPRGVRPRTLGRRAPRPDDRGEPRSSHRRGAGWSRLGARSAGDDQPRRGRRARDDLARWRRPARWREPAPPRVGLGAPLAAHRGRRPRSLRAPRHRRQPRSRSRLMRADAHGCALFRAGELRTPRRLLATRGRSEFLGALAVDTDRPTHSADRGGGNADRSRRRDNRGAARVFGSRTIGVWRRGAHRGPVRERRTGRSGDGRRRRHRRGRAHRLRRDACGERAPRADR